LHQEILRCSKDEMENIGSIAKFRRAKANSNNHFLYDPS
jgi:hypothetical protein